MTKDQILWFKRLEKCLNDMPEDTEIAICTVSNSSSRVLLCNKGDIDAYDSENDDRIHSDWQTVSLSDFKAANVIANSECI